MLHPSPASRRVWASETGNINFSPSGSGEGAGAAAPANRVGATAAEPDWRPVIEEAGLGALPTARVAPVWSPPVGCDARAAWQVRLGEEAKPGTRIEAASLRGKVVWARVLRPDELSRAGAAAATAAPPPANWRSLARSYLVTSVYLATLLAAALLAHANLRLGRADRRGTFRLALFVFAVLMLMWLVAAGHCSGRCGVAPSPRRLAAVSSQTAGTPAK